MLFNTIDFALFLPIVFVLYWFIFNKNLRLQNLLVVVASYVFYGWWDWKFLGLIFFSSLIDYSIALEIARKDNKKQKKRLLIISLIVNFGFLGFFKYFNFFQENFVNAFTLFGVNIEGSSLDIILPVGISFYTFQTLSYTIDVYRNKLKPTKDFVAFSAFVAFFPQLVAGPIERATHLLPQFYKKRNLNYQLVTEGLKQILWGLFKKVVIADNCAQFANEIFNNYSEMNGLTLLVGAICFTFQIYGDFSGYSDIAIGTSKLFGFDLMKNFSTPYFSRDIAEFWRRWHISLSTWFRDYLYIPLGGSRVTLFKKIRNTFIIFIVSGFWHGAEWTFVIWGGLNAIYFLPYLILNKNRKNTNVVAENSYFPSFKELTSIIFTFSITVFAWIFFRAENTTYAFDYIKRLFTESYFTTLSIDNRFQIKILFGLIIFQLLLEWVARKDAFTLKSIGNKQHRVIRFGLYYILILAIFCFGGKDQTFIYFQF